MLRREVPALLTTIMAIFVFLSAMLFPLEQKKVLARTDLLRQFMGNVAFLLGGINLVRLHSRNIKKSEHWLYSIWPLYFSFIILGGKGIMTHIQSLYDAHMFR